MLCAFECTNTMYAIINVYNVLCLTHNACNMYAAPFSIDDDNANFGMSYYRRLK